MSNHIILFDMDGTITPARKAMSSEMAESIKTILDAGHEVGIVTGSDMNFLMEQCQELFIRNMHQYIHFWPCNGSKYYKWSDKYVNLKEMYSLDMRDIMGERDFTNLILAINRAHQQALFAITALEIPITGGFITFRKSSINYSPVGRQYNPSGRKAFASHPKNIEIRKGIRRELQMLYAMGKIEEEKVHGKYSGDSIFNIEIVLGGETSIDIYPKGYGKEYVLRKIAPDKIGWFVGDNTGEHGNDRTIYEILKDSNYESGYSTTGPLETQKIISEILDRIEIKRY